MHETNWWAGESCMPVCMCACVCVCGGEGGWSGGGLHHIFSKSGVSRNAV